MSFCAADFRCDSVLFFTCFKVIKEMYVRFFVAPGLPVV